MRRPNKGPKIITRRDRSGAGVTGVFRFVKHDLRGQNLSYEDLHEVGDNGVVFKRPDLITEDISCHNMMLKRGIARFLYAALEGHVASRALHTPMITDSVDARCFDHFMLLADDAGYPADARPLWNESDGAFNASIPPNVAPHTPGVGKRGVLVNGTTSPPGLYKTLTNYLSTSPYREMEYNFFAQANTPTYSTGSITTDGSPNLPADGKLLTIDDGINPATTFEFRATGSPTPGNILVDTSGTPNADTMRDRLISAINSAGLNSFQDELFFTATNGGAATVTITHDVGGAIGNTTITDDFIPLGVWATTDPTGGTALEANNDYIDNLPIKAIGLAAAFDCGNGEANSHWGIRAVIGVAPTLQGVSDRVYVHEKVAGAAALKYYTNPADTVTVDGFVASTPNASVQVDSDLTGAGTDTIVQTTRRITVSTAVTDLSSTLGFDASHTRKTLRITGATNGGNNQDYTIEQVISPTEVQVFEPPAADATEDFCAVGDGVYTEYSGDRAFDGEVSSEGDSSSQWYGIVYQGGKYVAANPGPYRIGRIWASAKTIVGIRIVGPYGTNLQNYPNRFKVQTLHGSERPAYDTPPGVGDWTDRLDYSGTDQASSIYNAGDRGIEYLFSAPVSTKGVRLVDVVPQGTNSVDLEIGELYCFEALAAVTLSSDTLKLATDGGPTYRTFNLTDTTATQDVQDLVDAIDPHLRGWELEALKSDFGYLWVRGTVGGDNSRVNLDSVTNGSTASQKLGFTASAGATAQEDGVTQTIIKYPGDALTLIYRISISGDLLQP